MNFLRIFFLLFFSFLSFQIVAAWQPKFKVEDKVVAQNLRATQYNGAIGEIKTVPKDASDRYSVLFNGHEKALGLKEENLKKYESIDDILDAALAEMDGGAPQAAPVSSSQKPNPQSILKAIFGNPEKLSHIFSLTSSMFSGNNVNPTSLREVMGAFADLLQNFGDKGAKRAKEIRTELASLSDQNLVAQFNVRACELRELRATLRDGLNRLRTQHFPGGVVPEDSQGFRVEESAERNKAMREVPFTPEMGGSKCPICLEELIAGNKIVTPDCPCSAYYHKECLCEWLSTVSSCPTCRKNFR